MRLPCHCVPNARRAGGFNMVEMLASIGLVLTLVVLVLPSLESARATSRDLNCMADLHAMGSMMERHIEKHDGSVPPLFYDNKDNPDGTVDVNIVPRKAGPSGWSSFKDVVWRDGEDTDPSPVPLQKSSTHVTGKPTSYSYNIDLLECGGNFKQLMDYRSPSSITVLHDGGSGVDTAGTYKDGLDYAVQTAEYRHDAGDRAYVLFADWHVAAVKDIRNVYTPACKPVEDADATIGTVGYGAMSTSSSSDGGSSSPGNSGSAGGGNNGGGNNGGNNGNSDANIKVKFSTDNRSVRVKSTKDLSNVVLEVKDHENVKFDNLSGYTGTFSSPENRILTGIWVKSGNNLSGDCSGCGEYFDNPDN